MALIFFAGLVSHGFSLVGFFLSGAEIISAAEQQLLSADGVKDTSFVTVRVTLDEDSKVLVEGFQVSKQCMEMVAEGVIGGKTFLMKIYVNS